MLAADKPVGGKECPMEHFHGLFDKTKYLVEDFSVTTDDGYIIKSWRVRLQPSLLEKLPAEYKKNINQPIHFQHGLGVTADSWFMNGEDKSPGFFLVNKGYDVWAGSNRGTKDCKSHINKNITKTEFFANSFQEMGLFDVPAWYKLILSKYDDENTKIIYIGHSQGTTQFFAAVADDSTKEYVRKYTKKFIAIAPIAYMTEIKDKEYLFLSKYVKLIDHITKLTGVDDVMDLGCFSPDTFVLKNFNKVCNAVPSACAKLVDSYVGDSDVNNIVGRINILLAYFPSGDSVRSYEHYGQLIYKTDEHGDAVFQAFDFGSEEENMKHYNQKTPTVWTFGDWDIDAAFIGLAEDELGTAGNIANLLKQIDPKYYTYDTIPKYAHITPIIPKQPEILFDLMEKALANLN